MRHFVDGRKVCLVDNSGTPYGPSMVLAKKSSVKTPTAKTAVARGTQGKFAIPPSQSTAIHTLEMVAESRPELRRGTMFGCEAIFTGRRAVLAVFGNELNLTLPNAQVETLLSNPSYRRFAPGGRVMRGWVLMPVSEAENLTASGSLLDDAIAYARSKDSGAKRS